MMRYIAGLDIGGTTARLKLAGETGAELGEFFGSGCSINTDGLEKSEACYRALVLPALEEKVLKAGDCAAICIAASGVDSPELADGCRRAFLNMGFPEAAVLVQNDCELFLNLSQGPALVLIAGTGSICFGRGADGTLVRTGGWGHILSDEGSAFGIGLDLIRHIGNHLDGRRPCPILYDDFHQQTGIGSLTALNDFVNDNLMNKAVIGALAPLAEHSYREQEHAGLSILEDAAWVLSDLVKDTCRKIKLTGETEAHLWLWGSVLVKNEILRTRLEELVQERYGNMVIQIPHMRALDAAVLTAQMYMKKR